MGRHPGVLSSMRVPKITKKSKGLDWYWNHEHGDPLFDFYTNARRVMRKQREYLGLSQRELAGLIGVSHRMVEYIESGSKGLTFLRAARMCSVLGLRIQDLALPWQETGDGEAPRRAPKIVPRRFREREARRPIIDAILARRAKESKGLG